MSETIHPHKPDQDQPAHDLPADSEHSSQSPLPHDSETSLQDTQEADSSHKSSNHEDQNHDDLSEAPHGYNEEPRTEYTHEKESSSENIFDETPFVPEDADDSDPVSESEDSTAWKKRLVDTATTIQERITDIIEQGKDTLQSRSSSPITPSPAEEDPHENPQTHEVLHIDEGLREERAVPLHALDTVQSSESTLTSSNGAQHASGSIRHWDTSRLTRRQYLSKAEVPILGGIALTALLLGGIAGAHWYDSIINHDRYQQEQIEDMLDSYTEPSHPVLTELAGASADSIVSRYTDEGLQVIDVNAVAKSTSNDIDIVKLPEGVSPSEAILAYARGIDSLSSTDAIRMLMGSWRITQENADTQDMRIKFADFTSGSTEAAIEQAIAHQGFDPAAATELSQDSKGNTFCQGTIETELGTYDWTVSAIALSEAFDVSGLPRDAQYVGIRLQQKKPA